MTKQIHNQDSLEARLKHINKRSNELPGLAAVKQTTPLEISTPLHSPYANITAEGVVTTGPDDEKEGLALHTTLRTNNAPHPELTNYVKKGSLDVTSYLQGSHSAITEARSSLHQPGASQNDTILHVLKAAQEGITRLEKTHNALMNKGYGVRAWRQNNDATTITYTMTSQNADQTNKEVEQWYDLPITKT